MIRLHHSHQTRSMRTLWLLHELAVPFEVVVHAFDKSLRDPTFLELSPAGRVPALELDGATFFETGALTQILCERFPEAGLGRAPDHSERGDWLVWVHFAETISQHSAALTQQHVALYEDAMRSPIVMKLEAKRLEKCYKAVDDRLREMGGAGHLLESGFSAADISVGQAIYMARHFAKIEPFEALTDWYGRITEREGFKASVPSDPKAGIYQRSFYEAWA